jgi:Mn2+/Fe2+ NRAMP family transporter
LEHREQSRFVILPTKLLGAIYVAIGIFLAANKDYFQNLDTAKRVLSALLAILLWPLLLLDVNLHIK